MKRKGKVSVAMATYNGEKYIKEQIESILINLNEHDELIISDDNSKDNTINIIKEIQKKDSRLKLYNGPCLGVKQNFANAIKYCEGEYIFLCDQDDIWNDIKVSTVLKYFKNDSKITCIVHDCNVINNKKETIIDSFFKHRKSKPGILGNIFRNKYLGCCMAFRSDMKEYILPIPNDIEMHDQWIGIICEKYGKSKFIGHKLISYRRHEDNVSSMKHYPLKKMIKNRYIFIKRIVGR